MKRKQYLVIGLGRFGSSVATTLYELGNEVVAVDVHEENVEQVMNNVTHAAIVDATKERALKAIGVSDFDAVIVGIGSDVQANILATMNAKNLGAKVVITKAVDEMTRRVLERIGADQVIRPEYDMGERLARQLSSPNLIERLDLDEDHAIMELEASERVVGSLRDLNFTGRFNVQVIAIHHDKTDTLSIAPKADAYIERKDKVTFIGKIESLNILRDYMDS